MRRGRIAHSCRANGRVIGSVPRGQIDDPKPGTTADDPSAPMRAGVYRSCNLELACRVIGSMGCGTWGRQKPKLDLSRPRPFGRVARDGGRENLGPDRLCETLRPLMRLSDKGQHAMPTKHPNAGEGSSIR
jgi:hypothetical protein